jgi:hypothetical protein
METLLSIGLLAAWGLGRGHARLTVTLEMVHGCHGFSC